MTYMEPFEETCIVGYGAVVFDGHPLTFIGMMYDDPENANANYNMLRMILDAGTEIKINFVGMKMLVFLDDMPIPLVEMEDINEQTSILFMQSLVANDGDLMVMVSSKRDKDKTGKQQWRYIRLNIHGTSIPKYGLFAAHMEKN